MAVGTSLGSVLFFTENGKMLFEETFAANSPIIRLSMDYSEVIFYVTGEGVNSGWAAILCRDRERHLRRQCLLPPRHPPPEQICCESGCHLPVDDGFR